MSASGNTNSPRLTENYGAVRIAAQTFEKLHRVMEKFLRVVPPVEESETQGNGQQREQVEGETWCRSPCRGNTQEVALGHPGRPVFGWAQAFLSYSLFVDPR